MRLTVFHGNKSEFIQAVIDGKFKEQFANLGFVFSVDELPEKESGSDYEAGLRAKIKELGGKPGGRSSIATLEKQLEGLKDGDNQD